VVFKALLNYGYEAEAKRVAEKYVTLVEMNFEETGNLWEKYNGLTGKVASDEYEAPPMMGWTSGVYIYFLKFLGKLL
jgi:alpha,alpha-trehalase